MSTIRANSITNTAGTGAPDFPNGLTATTIPAANLTGNVAAARITGALNASGSAPIYACRAWVNFNGTGTLAIRASGNVSSITDNGTGDYTINLATALPDANYSLSLACRNEIVAGDLAVNVKQGTDPTASSVRIQCTRFSDGPRDPLYVYAQFFR